MSGPRLLDLFCGAGGAAMGYHRAGFDVVGVDINPQPRYPFEFHQADAVDLLRDIAGCRDLPGFYEVDAIHASPPCQFFSTMSAMPNAREHVDLLTPTREWLARMTVPWVIENVPGAPLNAAPPSLFSDTSGVTLCGSMFGLTADFDGTTYELRRHRLFESNVPLAQPACRHRYPVIGFYGDHARTRQRTVAGHRDRGGDITGLDRKMPLVRDLMGIDWMRWDEAVLAIPPAYTEFIGMQLLDRVPAPLVEGEQG